MRKLFGNIFVITAPSGAGKSSLIKALLKEYPSMFLSISCTTRRPRPGEKEDKDYRYLSENDFKNMCNKGMLLEWAKVHGNFYGTPRDFVDQTISSGNDILLEIDWQGTQQIKQHYPEACTIFIIPPSIEELETRLIARAQDDLHVIGRRLLMATSEISHAEECEYIVINENFYNALAELIQIVNVSKLKFSNQILKNPLLFSKLGIN